jgi:hypothetical protein
MQPRTALTILVVGMGGRSRQMTNDQNVFPELDADIVRDGVLEAIEGFPFIKGVLLYRDKKGISSYVLVFVIPEKLRKDGAYTRFMGYDASFDRRIVLEGAFRKASKEKPSSFSEIEAASYADHALRDRIVSGARHWVLYEAAAGQGRPEVLMTPRERSRSQFEKGLLAFEKRLLKKDPSLSVPNIAKSARTQQDDWLYRLRPGSKELPRQETIEKYLRRLRKKKA